MNKRILIIVVEKISVTFGGINQERPLFIQRPLLLVIHSPKDPELTYSDWRWRQFLIWFLINIGLQVIFDYLDHMFIALYEFKVRSGFEKQLEDNWAIVTDYIYNERGSLGSRLHKTQDGTYVAYAQWPSESQYNLDTPLPPVAMNARSLMKDACETQTVLKLMSVTNDLFKD